jgi:hypothetical protein
MPLHSLKESSPDLSVARQVGSIAVQERRDSAELKAQLEDYMARILRIQDQL